VAKKLSRDAILKQVLTVLVEGWGRAAVNRALNELDGDRSSRAKPNARSRTVDRRSAGAVALVERSHVQLHKRELLLRFAADFDDNRALPRLSDIRAFLAAHNVPVRELKERDQAFRRIFPILEKMSEKGLLRVISRAHHSGPAQLDDISNAIKGSGEVIRGDGADAD
jgi:hypothetical protein